MTERNFFGRFVKYITPSLILASAFLAGCQSGEGEPFAPSIAFPRAIDLKPTSGMFPVASVDGTAATAATTVSLLADTDLALLLRNRGGIVTGCAIEPEVLGLTFTKVGNTCAISGQVPLMTDGANTVIPASVKLTATNQTGSNSLTLNFFKLINASEAYLGSINGEGIFAQGEGDARMLTTNPVAIVPDSPPNLRFNNIAGAIGTLDCTLTGAPATLMIAPDAANGDCLLTGTVAKQPEDSAPTEENPASFTVRLGDSSIVLRYYQANPPLCSAVELADAPESETYPILTGTGDAAEKFYVRGELSGWATQDRFLFEHKEGGNLQVIATITTMGAINNYNASATQFKFSATEWSTQGYIYDGTATVVRSDNLPIGEVLPFTLMDGFEFNNAVSLDLGATYSFLLDTGASTFVIQQCLPATP